MRALEKLPADRWTTAREFAAALHGGSSAAAPIRCPRPSTTSARWRSSWPRRASAASGGCCRSASCRRPRPCARCSTTGPCWRSAGSTWPTASRSPASRCGAPRRWAPSCHGPTSSERPFLEQLPVRLGGATQTIGAAAASAEDAELLEVPVGSPVLTAERITRSVDDVPVLVSEHVFPAHRTRFAVELPVDDGVAPAGPPPRRRLTAGPTARTPQRRLRGIGDPQGDTNSSKTRRRRISRTTARTTGPRPASVGSSRR